MDGDHPRSSSPPRDGAADAVLWSGERAAGPIRLPAANADRFVAEFNQRYGVLGWTMNPASQRRRPQNDGS